MFCLIPWTLFIYSDLSSYSNSSSGLFFLINFLRIFIYLWTLSLNLVSLPTWPCTCLGWCSRGSISWRGIWGELLLLSILYWRESKINEWDFYINLGEIASNQKRQYILFIHVLNSPTKSKRSALTSTIDFLNVSSYLCSTIVLKWGIVNEYVKSSFLL